MDVSGRTRLVGLIGGPEQVAVSLSPSIHNAAFEALEMDWLYVTFPVVDEVGTAIKGLAASGVRGMNVTMPHKIAAARAVDRLSGIAETIGAINTVDVRSEGIVGWNTDAEGFARFLEEDVEIDVHGFNVLIVGSGGAARAVIAGLAQVGVASFHVLCRRPDAAAGLDLVSGSIPIRRSPLGSDFDPGDADLVVNATPVGQKGEDPLLDVEKLKETACVIDLVIDPPITRFVEKARASGLTAHGGLGMLIHQAALAFSIWTGVEPPLKAMSSGALRELRKH